MSNWSSGLDLHVHLPCFKKLSPPWYETRSSEKPQQDQQSKQNDHLNLINSENLGLFIIKMQIASVK